jgi:uncharacterized protein
MSDVRIEKSASELLRETRIEVAPATYVIVGISHHDWTRLLENSDLSPRSDVPFMIFRDQKEVTLLVEEIDWERMRHMLRDARIERDFRLITLDILLPWNVVGYLARITDMLAKAGISAGVLSSFSSDHLLIKQQDLGKVLRVLGEHVGDLC